MEIEERKRAEQELRAREEKFRNIFHAASVAILEVDPTSLVRKLSLLPPSTKENLKQELKEDALLRAELVQSMQIIDINDATLSMFGAKNKEEFQGRLSEIFFEKSYQWAESGLQALSLQRNFFETSCSLLTLNKQELEVLVQLKMFPNNSGKWLNNDHRFDRNQIIEGTTAAIAKNGSGRADGRRYRSRF